MEEFRKSAPIQEVLIRNDHLDKYQGARAADSLARPRRPTPYSGRRLNLSVTADIPNGAGIFVKVTRAHFDFRLRALGGLLCWLFRSSCFCPSSGLGFRHNKPAFPPTTAKLYSPMAQAVT